MSVGKIAVYTITLSGNLTKDEGNGHPGGIERLFR
jgi:hypothetical protein